jgi:hypothetical protein
MMTGDVGRGALWFLWKSLSLPVFVFLAILEPVVRVVLGSLALLCVLAAFFFKLIGAPHFPFVLMLGTSLGLGFLLVCYQALLRLLRR